MPTFGSLFAGIGGIDLGLERAGWTGRWQVEYEPFCQRVLAKHWPDVPRYGDIRDVDWSTVERVDLIAGGFPCQPVSTAGRRLIQADDRWLWPEFARCIRELGPRYVLVENVPGLLVGGGMDEVLGDLADLGYDTEWESIPAAAVGAPHLRYRVWILAYANGRQLRREPVALAGSGGEAISGDDGAARPLAGAGDVAYADRQRQGRATSLGSSGVAGSRSEEASPEPDGAGTRAVSDTDGGRREGERQPRLLDGLGSAFGSDADRRNRPVADTDGTGPQGWAIQPERPDQRTLGSGGMAYADELRWIGRSGEQREGWWRQPSDGGWWLTEPDMGRVAHGVPARVDRLRSLGNAVVPQVVEVIGRRILEAEA